MRQNKVLKRYKLLAALMVCLMGLAGCGMQMPALDFSFFGGGDAGPQGFHDHLAREYKNLALYQQEHTNDADGATHFQAKARRALRGQDVGPDELAQRRVPEFASAELESARAYLVDALTYMKTPQNEALLAMAQTRFDCWLAHQEDFPDEDAYIACRDEFQESLGLLALPAAYNRVYRIHFESGRAALSAEDRALMADMAERYRGRDHWRFTLKGYTDSKGDRRSNEILSMRRAIAVKNTLAQHGVPLEQVEISAEGEVSSAEDGDSAEDSRRVEIRVRPVYIDADGHLKRAPGWRHST